MLISTTRPKCLMLALLIIMLISNLGELLASGEKPQTTKPSWLASIFRSVKEATDFSDVINNNCNETVNSMTKDINRLNSFLYPEKNYDNIDKSNDVGENESIPESDGEKAEASPSLGTPNSGAVMAVKQ